jgi:O-antigen/teichoic acid export membrane protein
MGSAVPEASVTDARPQSANRDTRQVARNAAASYVTLVAQIASGLIVTPLLFRSLGTAAFGTWSLLVSLVGYLGLLELGIGTATLRLVAVRSGEAASGEIDDVLGSSRSLYIPVVALTALATAVIATVVVELPGASGTTAFDARVAFIALATGQMFALIMNVYPAYIYGTGRADVLYGVGTVFTVVLSASQAVTVLLDADVKLLATVTAGLTVVNAWMLSRLARKLLGGYRVRRRDGSKATRRHIFRFGLQNAGVGLVASLSQQFDIFIIGALKPAGVVGAYAVASRVAVFAKNLATRASDVLVPTFADGGVQQDADRQHLLFTEATIFASVALAPLFILAACFGEPLLKLWLGSVPAGSTTVLVILLGTATVQAIGHVGFVYFNGLGELSLFVKLGSVIAIANFAGSIAATVAIGIAGPALASLAATVLFDTTVVPRAAAARMGRRPDELYRPLLEVVVPPTLIGALVGLLSREILPASPHLGALTAAVGVVLMSFIGVLALTLGARRRVQSRGLLRRRRSVSA